MSSLVVRLILSPISNEKSPRHWHSNWSIVMPPIASRALSTRVPISCRSSQKGLFLTYCVMPSFVPALTLSPNSVAWQMAVNVRLVLLFKLKYLDLLISKTGLPLTSSRLKVNSHSWFIKYIVWVVFYNTFNACLFISWL